MYFDTVTALDRISFIRAAVLKIETIFGQKTAIMLTKTIMPINFQGALPSQPVPADNAHEVVAALLAKGYILSKEAMAVSAGAVATSRSAINNSQIANKMSMTAVNLDQKIGFREKLTAGAQTVNQSIKSVDEKYGVRDRTKSALVTAEQKVNEAGAALMQNKYVQSGSAWLSSAFSRVTKVTDDITLKTKEKIHEHEGATAAIPTEVAAPPAPVSGAGQPAPTSYGGLSNTASPAVVPHAP